MDLATAEIQLAEVPHGVKCIHVVVAAGGRTVTRSFSVSAGSAPVLSFGKLPVGPASFDGTAYNKQCPNETNPPGATPSWIADPVLTELHSGLPVSVALDFWRNNPVDGTAAFHEEAVTIGHAGDATYAVAADGTLYGWGDGFSGQLGGGVSAPSALEPVVVEGVSDLEGITGDSDHTCAWKGADVWCWGKNDKGQLGLGTTDTAIHAPTLVPRPWSVDVLKVDSGDSFSCAATVAHEIYCWGNNEHGQLGVGDKNPRLSPTLVQAGLFSLAYISVDTGDEQTCAIDTDRYVSCWGRNDRGQLGTGGNTDVVEPTLVDLAVGAVDLASGDMHTCMLRADGAVLCWGLNFTGQLGTGDRVDHLAGAVKVVGLTDAIGLAAGFDHTCAVKRDGGVACWGANYLGELGDGSGEDALTPVAVFGLTEAVAVSAEFDGACALRRNGEVLCWGYNGLGEAGDGTAVDAFVPSRVELEP